MMDIDWLKRLIRLVEESDIDSLEVERLTTRVRIRKSPAVGAAPPAVAPLSAPPATPAQSAAEPGLAGGAPPAAAVAPAANLHEVNSPMVGTFYRSPSPDAAPFVSVGDRIEQGQTLCILEAMKLMNELESEVSGVVREISAENGDPVEFGQLLFRIEAD